MTSKYLTNVFPERVVQLQKASKSYLHSIENVVEDCGPGMWSKRGSGAKTEVRGCQLVGNQFRASGFGPPAGLDRHCNMVATKGVRPPP